MGREISIVAKNQISTHYRIYSLLNKKGYDLNEARSKPLETDSNYIEMVLKLNVDDKLLAQVEKYLNKIIDVVEVKIS